MNEEIKNQNSVVTPSRENLITLGQVKDALDKRDLNVANQGTLDGSTLKIQKTDGNTTTD